MMPYLYLIGKALYPCIGLQGPSSQTLPWLDGHRRMHRIRLYPSLLSPHWR